MVHPKTDEQRARLQERVQSCLLFRTLDVQQLAEVLDAMFEHKVKAEEMVIRQGDDGDYFYVIETGVYNALINTDAGPKKVFTYENEGNFGELALLYNMPRAASIQVRNNTYLNILSSYSFFCQQNHTYKFLNKKIKCFRLKLPGHCGLWIDKPSEKLS